MVDGNTKHMQFSIVIPTCRRTYLLGRCLQQLAWDVQGLSPTDYEVIVTDDDKGSDTADFCKVHYPWVRYTRGPGRGPAANRNHGASLAFGNWLVFIDDDCLPQADLLRQYKEAIIMHPASLAFEGAIIPDNWDLLKEDMAECPVNIKGGCFWSANIMVNRILFLDIGGFDEEFFLPAQEDQDLYIRLKQKTGTIPFVSIAIVMHPVRKISLVHKIKQLPDSIYNWGLFARKNNIKPLLWKGYLSQLHAGWNNLKSLRLKSGTLNAITIIYLLPVYLMHERFKPQKSKV